MLVYFSVLIFLVLSFTEVKRTKFFLNPLSLFLLEWSVILSFSNMHLFGMYKPSDSTFLIFILGVIAFVIGYYFRIGILRKYKIKRIYYDENYQFEPRYSLLYVFGILCLAYYMLYLIHVVNSLSTFSLWAVQQYLRRNNEIISNQWIRVLGSFIFGPISFALPVITASDFWFGKRDKKLFVITAAILIVQLLATASRMTLLLFGIYIIAIGVYKLKKFGAIKNLKEKRRIRGLIYIIGIISVAIFAAMSLSRNLAIFKSLYLQLSIPPMMYETWKEYVDDIALIGYGEASLNGIFFPFFYVFQKALGFSQLPPNMQAVYDLINLTDSKWIMVGQDVSANAYVSIFWFLYVDGRYFGIIIGMIFFGAYCANMFLKLNRGMNSKSVSLYCMCLVTVVLSLCRMQFARTNFILALFFISFIAFKHVKLSERMKQ